MKNRSVRLVKRLSADKQRSKITFKDCKFFDCEFSCKGVQNIANQNDTFSQKKLLQDFLRVTYEASNNVCDINIRSSRFNSDGNIFVAYAYCNDQACCTFVLKLFLENETCKVFRSKKELQHQIGLHKYCQVRGPKRQLIKTELFNKKAILYKKKVINQQSKFLRFVGKQQNLRSLSTNSI